MKRPRERRAPTRHLRTISEVPTPPNQRRSKPRCHIDYRDAAADTPSLDRRLLRRVFAATLAADGQVEASVTVLLVDQPAMADLHRQCFGRGKVSDVVSVPDGSRDPHRGCVHLGDIAICPAVAWEVARRRAAASEDIARLAAEECLLYCLHGLLHLLGFDDQHPADRAVMWQRQTGILAGVGIVTGP